MRGSRLNPTPRPPGSRGASARRAARPRRTLQVVAGVASIAAAMVLWMDTSGAVATHPGGTDENGCHAGSETYHCHSGTETAAGVGTATTAVPGSQAPVVEAPQAGAPETAPPATAPPSTAAPTTAPPVAPPAPVPQVQGVQETQQPTDELARTGTSENAYFLALGLLLAGVLLVTTSGLVGQLPESDKGGFTFRTRNRVGDPVLVRVTTRL